MKKEYTKKDMDKAFESGIIIGKETTAKELFDIISKKMKAFSEKNMDNATITGTIEGYVIDYANKNNINLKE